MAVGMKALGEARAARRRGRFGVCWLSFVLLAAVPGSAWQEQPPSLSSLAGERLEYRLRWGVIPAAHASLEVLDLGTGRLTFRATARTLDYIDPIYPVRDTVESTVWVERLRADRYFKDAKEGRGHHRVEEIVFDLGLGLARYTRDDQPERQLAVPENVQDPLSCFFAYRTGEGTGDGVSELTITDGRKIITGTVRTVGWERVETPAGIFDTVIIEPQIEGLGGIFEKSPGARVLIWLTDDRWRRPVKLQSEVLIGRFTAELIRWEHPRSQAERGGSENEVE